MTQAKASERKAFCFKSFLDYAQGILACAAVIGAGGWFLTSGEYQGKANCSQKLNMVEITSAHTNVWWCSLELKISNVGERPLTLKTARIYVQCIQPQPDGFLLQTNNYGGYKWGDKIYNNDESNDSIHSKVLPGETCNQDFEFTMSTNVQIFRIYSYVNNSNIRLGYGWNSSCVYAMESNVPVDISESEK